MMKAKIQHGWYWENLPQSSLLLLLCLLADRILLVDLLILEGDSLQAGSDLALGEKNAKSVPCFAIPAKNFPDIGVALKFCRKLIKSTMKFKKSLLYSS